LREHSSKVQEAIANGRKARDILMPTEATVPPKPHKKRVVIVNTSIEEAANILSREVRGVIMMLDEMPILLNTLKLVGSPAQPFYMQAYDGAPYVVDRVKLNGDTIHISSL